MCFVHLLHWSDLTSYKLLVVQRARQYPAQAWPEYDFTDWSAMNLALQNFHLSSPPTAYTRQLLQASAASSPPRPLFVWIETNLSCAPPNTTVTHGIMDCPTFSQDDCDTARPPVRSTGTLQSHHLLSVIPKTHLTFPITIKDRNIGLQCVQNR